MPIEQLTTDRKPASAYAATTAGENAGGVIDIKGLRTYLFTRSGIVKAVDDVSFSLRRGETLAVVGESGCGKSMTALSIMRLVPNPPGKIVGGTITLEGKDLVQLEESEMRDIRGNEISMIFQEPMTSLNPVMTIGKQIAEALILHRDLNRKEALKRAVEMLDLVRIPEPHHPDHAQSGCRRRDCATRHRHVRRQKGRRGRSRCPLWAAASPLYPRPLGLDPASGDHGRASPQFGPAVEGNSRHGAGVEQSAARLHLCAALRLRG